MHKEDIKNLTQSELRDKLAEIRQPSFRAKQIFFWVYKKGICDFDRMSNMPKPLKSALKEKFFISALECSKRLRAKDDTEKFVFKLQDNRHIETVYIPAKDRKTLCLSTQVGCRFKCVFCASGMRGFIRNLKPSEIVNQVIEGSGSFPRPLIPTLNEVNERDLGDPSALRPQACPERMRRNAPSLKGKNSTRGQLTNFVFMGMGEPLDNCDNVVKAIRIMNDPIGMGLGARRITVSTCGVIPGINVLARLGLQINLSVSLHAGNDKLRNELVPLNRRYPLSELIATCKNYTKTTGRIITLEYVLIKNKNSSLQDADELAAIARKLNAKVNLIKCSLVPGLEFIPPQQKDVEAFRRQLISKKVNVTLRQSKGDDIMASCGQLAGKIET